MRRAVHRLKEAMRLTRNGLMGYLGRADFERWGAAEGLEDWWVARTQLIAELVPAHTQVIEFGAGKRQLESRLPPGCVYTPSDLVDRGPGTIVFDLNRRPLPDLRNRHFQVAVFGGVLEYLRDVPGVAAWLNSMQIETCVLSFDAVPEGIPPRERYREKKRRLYYGYMNTLTEAQLLAAFQAAGYRLEERRTWTKQVIARLSRP